jgi:D-tyrosyl-tRNA(Tyr) deacylase
MRAVVQRVAEASVTVAGKQVAAIGPGLLVLVSFGREESPAHLDFLARKIAELRIFEDEEGRMNLSVREVGGGVLVVPNFTLHADWRRGRRPSFSAAADPEQAKRLFAEFLARLRQQDVPVQSGLFGEHMQVVLVNDGPVTLVLDSQHPS